MTEEKEESIFDGAEVTEELPEKMDESPQEEEEEYVEFTPIISKESSKEKLERKGKKEEADGKILTIEKWFFTKPRLKNQDGTDIPPKETMTEKKPYYPGKLGIRFKEDNLVEYYPNVKFFVNDGVVSRNVKLPREGESVVAKLVRMVIEKIGKPSDEISDMEILNWMVEKQVKIELSKGKFSGKEWFRNDIKEFVL